MGSPTHYFQLKSGTALRGSDPASSILIQRQNDIFSASTKDYTVYSVYSVLLGRAAITYEPLNASSWTACIDRRRPAIKRLAEADTITDNDALHSCVPGRRTCVRSV